MKINKKGLIVSFIIALFIWYTPSLSSEAGKYDNVLNTIYEQLVINGKSEAAFSSTEEIRLHELEAALCKVDKDTLYDGANLINRGRWKLTRKGTSYTVSIEDAYNITDADKLTDKMAQEIREIAGEDATEDTLFYEMNNYIKKTYKYDYSAKTQQNFVDSYNGDRKLVCNGYAQAVYLVGNKLGIDTDTVFGKDHVYNIIKVNGDYIGYDASCDVYIYGLVPEILGRLTPSTNANIILDSEEREYNLSLNEGKSFRYAGAGDIISAMAYNLLKYHRIYEIMIIVTMLAVACGIMMAVKKHVLQKKRKVKKSHKKGLGYAKQIHRK